MARELTGKHVLGIFVGAFGVIFSVNLFMAYKAIGTFPGVEAKNTYEASQNFDVTRKAQTALGWQVADSYADGQLMLNISQDETGQPAAVRDLQVLVGRATESTDDRMPVFVRKAGVWVAPVDLTPGKWVLRIAAIADDGTPFQQQRALFVGE